MVETQQLGESVSEALRSVFRRGSRYQTEKIVVVLVYLVLVAASAVWAFSGEGLENELGADFGIKRVEGITQRIYFLENLSSDSWTNVRVIINQRYLMALDKVEARERRTLKPDEFGYFYYIPRAWGREPWETLAKTPKPEYPAPMELDLKLVQFRASQGKLDLQIGPDGQAVAKTP